MKTIKSRIFPYGIMSLVENEKGFWAVRRHAYCPNCDWSPIRKIRASLEEAKAQFDRIPKMDFIMESPDPDDLWEWFTIGWREQRL